MQKFNALEEHIEQTEKYEVINIDTKDILNKIYRTQQYIEFQRYFGRGYHPTVVYMGQENFNEMMSKKDDFYNGTISFDIKSGTQNVFGMKVVVLPYMEGILVV